MRKKSVSILYCITLIAIAFWAFDARADQTFNTCIGCHGDFQAKPYISLKDGQTWADSLHNVHQSKVNKNCNFCHFGTSKIPVYLNKSNGMAGQAVLGCAGCHGRAEDKKAAVPSGYGAGLRQHHWNAGVTDCSAVGCHFDANPANYKPVGENIVPLNYAPIALYTSKPTDPCNKDGKENFGGTTIGLDNDGDGLYDSDDPDCQTLVACTDNDKDGYGSNGAATCANGTKVDCNDNNAAINQGAVEICDGIDNNCSGQIDEGVMNTYYKDNDGDGYGTPSLTIQGCTQSAGYAPNNTDCNDGDTKEHPNQTWYQDADSDGYSSGNIIVQCARPTGYKIASELQATSGDCNDNSSTVKPGVAEVCDGIDNNCNGTVDDGIASTPTTCGVGACASTGVQQCTNGKMADTCAPKASQTEGPFGSSTCSDSLDNDCDGTTDAADASCAQACVPSTEVCDGKDNDCDGQIDEGLTSTPTTCGVGTCASAGTLSCVSGQMVDSCKAGTPSAEICDGKDNNCNGTVDDGIASTPTTCGVGVCAATGQSTCQNGKIVNTCTTGTSQAEGPFSSSTCSDSLDNDCDGKTDAADASCAQACVPSTEVCDGKDNDCDGQIDEGLTSTPTTCGVGTCASAGTLSCVSGQMVDSCKAGTPSAEVCDGKDNNCNGTVDDGIAATPTTCGVGVCAATGQSTCQNGKIVNTCTAGTSQTEGPTGDPTCGDGLDNDCNGLTDTADSKCASTVCIDRDGDGYGANGDPSCPNGTAIDCNDRKAAVNPGAVELCDGRDNNCDGQVDEGVMTTYYKDADRDGYGDPLISKQSCRKPLRYVSNNNDCNVSNRKIHPGTVEICDGKDNNCDGQVDEGVQQTFYMDADRDGYGSASVSIQSCKAPEGYVNNNTDCSDVNSTVHAGTAGICDNQGGDDGDGDSDHDGDDGDGDGDHDGDFIHNFTTGCTSCHTPHNEITDCMSCHSGLKED